MPKTINHIVIYSGGMDSFTLLHWVKQKVERLNAAEAELWSRLSDEQKDDVTREEHCIIALSFDYRQRHAKELTRAITTTYRLGIAHKILDLGVLKSVAKGSALTDDIAVPHGHYAAESMKQTVVPGRNTVMLALTLAYAEGLDPRAEAVIYYGAHAGDHHIYPDCRPEFIRAMIDTIYEASDGRVQLAAPFTHFTKSSILGWGLTNGLVEIDYARTWSCYEGGEHPCGKCGACVERAEAFADNGAIDPLVVIA